MGETADQFEGGMSAKADFLRDRLPGGGDDEKLCGSKYGLNYFEQLRTEWSLLADPWPLIGPAGEQRMKDLLGTPPEKLTFSDLYAFERLLLRATPFDRLKRIAIAIRQEYQDAVGTDGYADYEKALPAPADGTNEGELRTDLEQLQSELQWLYIIQPLEERARNSLTKWLLLAMFLLTVLILFGIFAWKRTHEGQMLPAFFFVLFAGALGATFSAQRRIQTTVGARSTLVNIIRSGSVRLSVQIAPVIGALSAIVIAFLFASHLLSGALFPKYEVWDLFHSLTFGSGDGDSMFAMLIIWSFIAGFAERLVPDALDRFASDAAKKPADASSGQ